MTNWKVVYPSFTPDPLSSFISTYLIIEGSKIPLKPLVLALQTLHSGEVVAHVVQVQRVVLLLDPVLRLVSVPTQRRGEYLMAAEFGFKTNVGKGEKSKGEISNKRFKLSTFIYRLYFIKQFPKLFSHYVQGLNSQWYRLVYMFTQCFPLKLKHQRLKLEENMGRELDIQTTYLWYRCTSVIFCDFDHNPSPLIGLCISTHLLTP